MLVIYTDDIIKGCKFVGIVFFDVDAPHDVAVELIEKKQMSGSG